VKKARRDISSRDWISRVFHARPRVRPARRNFSVTSSGVFAARSHTSPRDAYKRARASRLCPTSPLDKVAAGINWPCSPRCIPVDLLELQHET